MPQGQEVGGAGLGGVGQTVDLATVFADTVVWLQYQRLVGQALLPEPPLVEP